MRKFFSLFLAAIALFSFQAFAHAQAPAAPNQAAKVEAATSVLDQIMRVPDNAIPEALLKNAYGVAVIPGVVSAAMGIGTTHGQGILVVKTPAGTWSNPAFIDLSGASLGPQLGVESTDVVLVFKTPQSVSAVTNGNLTLGIDTSIAAGPIGRNGQLATDAQMNAEILSYSRSRGIFAGISLHGAEINLDHSANVAFYGRPDITPNMIFASSGIIAPRVAGRFVCTLASYSQTPMRACG